jgi:iron complex outermembrane receptor protein
MRTLFVFLAAVCALSASDSLQAVLAGKVLDPSGAAVAGARVKLTRHAAGTVASVTTDNDGRFAARELAPGSYRVAAEASGFVPYLSGGVEVREGQRVVLDVMLTVSPVSESVTVTAKAPPAEGAFETRPHNTREVLEIREVRESAARDVGEAIAGLEGLWKIRKGGIANDVVLRGFQQNNLSVLIDGVRINGACPNHMDPAAFHVDFAEIDSVQVIKGPFDIRNQGSLGGTVNVVTRRRADGFRVTPNLGAGSFGYYNPSLQGSYSAGGLYASGGYSYRRSEPYRDGSGRRVTDYANYTAQGGGRNAFDINTGWIKLGASLPRNQSFEVTYTRQQGGLTLYPYLLMDAVYDNADRAGASWGVRELTGLVRQVHAQAYFTRVKHWMTDELRTSSAGAPRGFGMATFAATKALGGRVEAELPGTLVGVEGYRRNWNAVNTMRMSGIYSDQPSMPDVQMLVGGFYGQHRQVLGKLQLTAGARLDAASSEARGESLNTAIYWAYQGTRSTSKGDLNPSGTFWLTYALPKGLELFGGVGSTVRLPDPQERYFALKRSGSDWVGNPNLVPTRNTEADLGLNIRTGRFSLRPTLFYSRLDNFIALSSRRIQNPVMGIMNAVARSYENVDARIHGGEVSYSIGFSRSVLLSGGVSVARGIQYAKPAAAPPGASIAEMPPLKSRTSLRYGNRLFFTEVEGRAIARQDRVDPNLREQPTPGYVLLGVRGGVHHRRLNLAAGVDNLLNRFYYDHLSFQRDPFRTGVRVPDPGRNLYLNLSIVLE